MFAFFSLLLGVHSACNADGYELGGGGGGSGDDDGGPGGDGDGGSGDGGSGDGDGGTGGIDAGDPDCVVGPDDDCDGEDDDCDGEFDEDVDLTGDEANCGACGNGCVAPHSIGTCNASVCEYDCLDGFYDYDDLPGCEYQCFETNGGVERCDFADNDCNGLEDETFDTNTDEDNCGGCGQLCRPANATPVCTGGVCGYADCEPGYADVDGADGPDPEDVPGCEYTCPENPPLEDEECDGEDDDCDNEVDEDAVVADECTDFPGFGGIGTCTMGSETCSFGTTVCTGDVGPVSESCDSLDNDCNGVIDNGFNLNTDEQNCGSCGFVCQLDNAVPICTSRVCRVFACLSGWVDANDDDADGCEYQCTPSGPEVCDGRDNDCDTLTDTADPDLDTPDNFCENDIDSECANAAPICGPELAGAGCETTIQWRCIYNDPTRDEETDACGDLVPQEADCDNRDNDCDGRVDEGDILKGTACSDGDLGECADTGVFVCQNDPGDLNPNTGLRCNAVDGGSEGGPEQCDNLDNDCDGVIDDGAPAETVLIDDGAGPLAPFYIYAYEASKPDATGVSSGTATHRSCSEPGVMPWRLVSRVDAAAACAAGGRRLCTDEEWELACSTTADFLFPYGGTTLDDYEPDTCNGRDFDTVPGGQNQDNPVAAGEMDQCFADWGAAGDVFDMSGNIKEWTSTEVDTDAFRVRGGSYDNVKQGLTCEFDFIAFDEDVEFPNLGFRCCSATP